MSGMVKIALRQKISLFVFGIILSLVFLEIALRLFGVFYLSAQARRNKISLERWGEFRILCLGESTTAEGGWNSYPRQLARLLRQRMPDKKICVINKGVPGTTTTKIFSLLPSYLDEYDPHMVIVMMGINDRDHVIFVEKNLWGRFISIIKDMRIYKMMRFSKIIVQQQKILRDIYLERARLYAETENYEKAEQMFKKAIRATPEDPYPYIEFGRYFQEIKADFKEAEIQFGQALRVSPDAYGNYIDFGLYYQEQGRYPEAEEVFKNVIALLPKHPDAYTQLGFLYALQGKMEAAEAIFKENCENFPRDYRVVLALAIFYQTRGNLALAEKLFSEAMDIDSKREEAYIRLGQCYNLEGKYKEAQEQLKRVIAMYPKNIGLYIELSRSYLAQKDFAQAEAILKKAVKIEPKNKMTQIELAWLFSAQKNKALAEKYFIKALNMSLEASEDVFKELAKYYYEQDKYLETEEIILDYIRRVRSTDNYLPSTKMHYQKLRDIVLAKGIPLVCVQYPRRRLQPLKDILVSKGPIIFVDNEKIFNESVTKGAYEDYFIDRFAGDFGHCTQKGNYLLASNIAEVLLREYFHK